MPIPICRGVRALLAGAVMFLLLARGVLAQPTGFSNLHLQSPHVTSYEFFGRAVASMGTQLVVGAPGSSIGQFGSLPGHIYVMSIDGTFSRVIQNPSGTPGDGFGAAVAVTGMDILVGAPFDDTLATNAGAAYLFDGVSGSVLQTLVVPGSGSNSQCGRAVATLGGAPLVMCDGVYLFDAGTGAVVRHFTAPGCTGGLGLATIGGDVLSAGYGGTICRFDGATGAVVQTYVDPEPGLGGAFGSSIGVDGNVVVVGGQGFSGARESMYVFDGTTGILLQTIRGPYYGTPYNAGFGTAVAAAGGVLVGSGWYSARFYDGMSYAFLGEVGPEDFRRDASRDTVTPVFGTSFAIWTDTLQPNVARGSVNLLDRCGNGILSPAEQCDDGNTTSGDGCSATCRLELCPQTFPVACHSIDPQGSSTVLLRKKTGSFGQNGDQFVWKWKGASSLADFGDPTIGSTYQLCFYDDLFVTPDLTIDLAIPSGALCDGLPCWRRSGTSGFAYKDPDRTPSGIEKVVIQVKDAQGRIAVSGRGGRLGFPVMDVHDPFPFNFGWSVVMVDGSSGQCWAAGSGAIQNQRGKYKGTARGS